MKTPRLEFVLGLFLAFVLSVAFSFTLEDLQDGRDRNSAKIQLKLEKEAEKKGEKSRREKTAMRELHLAFGADLPLALEARVTVQKDVIKKLVEVGRQADAATQKVETIGSLWEKTLVSTPEGVLKRLEIQQEYDKAEKERKESYEKFWQACRAARGAGFNEEARALECP